MRVNFMRKITITIILSAALALVVAVIIYSSTATTKDDSSLVAVNGDSVGGVAGASAKLKTEDRLKLVKQGEDVARMLNILNSVNLKTEIFTDPAFLDLDDFSVSIPKKETGRKNPFLPIVSSN